jgi:DNA-binding XRE family transcriptional regulator
MNEEANQFPDLLRAHRKRLNLNQPEAAGLLGVSKRTIELWEAGHILPAELTQEGALTRLSLFTPQPPKKRKPPRKKMLTTFG